MNNGTRFSATIEFLPGHRAAIIELTDSRGEWAGGFRFDLPRAASTGRASLREHGYSAAERAAALKGGELDRFSDWEAKRPSRPRPAPVDPRDAFDVPCGSRVSGPLLRRPANALNIEVGAPLDRCLNKLPSHWKGSGRSALRWRASGGGPEVFGLCTPNACPVRR